MPEFFARRLKEVFFFCCLLGVWMHALPKNWAIFQTTPFYDWSGLWQHWNMFAPHPAFESHLMQIEYDLPDGSRVSVDLPNHHAWKKDPPYSPVILERFRKWAPEALIKKGNEHLHRPAVQYFAKLRHVEHYVKARIIQHWVNVHEAQPISRPQQYTRRHVLYEEHTR